MKNVRPYVIYGKHQLSAFHAKVEAIVKQWLRDWIVDFDSSQISLVLTTDMSDIQRDRSCLRVSCIEGGWCASSLGPDSLSGFIGLLLGQQATPFYAGGQGIMTAVVDKTMTDLCSRLIRAEASAEIMIADVVHQPLPATAFRTGSGCIVLTLNLQGANLFLIVSHHVVERCLRSCDVKTSVTGQSVRPSLTKTESAIGGQTLRVQVRLGEADLSVAALTMLQVGDVIELDKGIHDPSEVIFDASRTRCLGYLGRTAHQYALRIDKIETQ